METKYIVDLNDYGAIYEFEKFLKRYNIQYKPLNNLGMFLIYTTPSHASRIRTLSYVDDISEDEKIPTENIDCSPINIYELF